MSTMFSRLTALAATALVIAGCQSAEEMRAADANRCLSYGFRPNTDAFAECLQRIDLDRSAERRAFRYGGYDDGPWGWNGPVVVYR